MENTKRINLKTYLSKLDKEDLLDIISKLCAFNAKNKKYVENLIIEPSKDNYSALVEEAKNKIYIFIYGRSLTSKNCLKLRDAKNVIAEYSKLLNKNPLYVADLYLYYTEVCTMFTKDFGDINESFYNSSESSLSNFAKIMKKEPDLIKIFKERLNKLSNDSKHIGWGYSDGIDEILYEIKNIIV